jgi:hypothetical protein
MQFARAVTFARVDISGSGAVQWEGGLAAFSDSALTAALGRTPLEHEVAAAGVAPEDALALTVTVKLRGKVSGNGDTSDDGTVTWTPVLRGSGRGTAHSTVVDGQGPVGAVLSIARSVVVVHVSGHRVERAGGVARHPPSSLAGVAEPRRLVNWPTLRAASSTVGSFSTFSI